MKENISVNKNNEDQSKILLNASLEQNPVLGYYILSKRIETIDTQINKVDAK